MPTFLQFGCSGGKKKSRKGRFPGQFTEHPEMNIHLNTNDEHLSANLSSHSRNGSNNKICRWTSHRATLLFWNSHYASSLRYIKGPKKWPELYYDPTGSCDRKVKSILFMSYKYWGFISLRPLKLNTAEKTLILNLIFIQFKDMSAAVANLSVLDLLP